MLTIDDPELERFIRSEAARTGEDPVLVLRRYLPLRHERDGAGMAEVPAEERARRMAVTRAIQRELAALPHLDARSIDEILGYDEHGLPS